ncbi:hypothetical protein CTAYLR_005112 [Chrysophaeum taylorii]|uniref:Uncharacterized protein n=1 Tax=Chrysophaeum taylorii TaxID=2483200 RepID=A0AAD7UFW9_9STRA|nr:hypothetical protein CTAYLR_005112 [Chrysophaeum taylorii]
MAEPTKTRNPFHVDVPVATESPPVVAATAAPPGGPTESQATQFLFYERYSISPGPRGVAVLPAMCCCILTTLVIVLSCVYGTLVQPHIKVDEVVRGSSITAKLRNKNSYPATWRHFNVDLMLKIDSQVYRVLTFVREKSVTVGKGDSKDFYLSGASDVNEEAYLRMVSLCRLNGEAELKLRGSARGKMKNGAAARLRNVKSKWRTATCTYDFY